MVGVQGGCCGPGVQACVGTAGTGDDVGAYPSVVMKPHERLGVEQPGNLGSPSHWPQTPPQ